MMTSTPAIPQHTDGRTVRDVVEHSPELVNEVWCRKIFRQVLQSLELQYAMQMPHRAITPDTIVILDSGDPMLLPSPPEAGEPDAAADLHALACVIHYAITGESRPHATLRGRGLEGYSDSLVSAVDRCLAPDPRERPQTIDELRNLLGIVALGPAAPAGQGFAPVAQPRDFIPVADPAHPVAGRGALWTPLGGGMQRWLLIGAAATVLLGALAALLALLHNDSGDMVVLRLPNEQRQANGLDPNETLLAPQGDRASAAGTALAAPAYPGAAGTHAPPAGAHAAPGVATPGVTHGAAPPGVATTIYKVMIKPWGTVFVNGAEHGVSPPLKRLALPPGQHTIRIVNPAFPEHSMVIDAGHAATGEIVHEFPDASE